ncbi:MAG: FAD-dependent oxidoreductase, partial [Spirochaetaceae bacterium]
GAGLLDADTALSTIRTLAGDAGAVFHWDSSVERVRRDDGAWELDILRADAPIHAHRVVVAAGPWTTGLIERSPDLSLPVLPPITVLQCEPIYVEPARPVDADPLFFIHPDADYADGLYVQPQPATRDGYPRDAYPRDAYPRDAYPRLLKVGRHGGTGHLDPTNPVRGPIEDHGRMVDRLAQFVPAVEGGRVRGFDTCYYSVTPDDGFIVDSVGGGLFIAAGFSGHGFKFAPVIGRAAAELLLDGETAYEVGGMTLARFAL